MSKAHRRRIVLQRERVHHYIESHELEPWIARARVHIQDRWVRQQEARGIRIGTGCVAYMRRRA